MTLLVADVGGTNSRLALAEGGQVLPETLRRFDNAAYESFDAVVAAYLADLAPQHLAACCVAMAGPVSGGEGRLTNRDWTLSAANLQSAARSDTAQVINDMTALGYAVGNLPAKSLIALSPPETRAPRNGQSLVIGIGTGFNVCPLKRMKTGNVACLEAEGGHVSLPQSVRKRLATALPAQTASFETVEDLFSGRGLSRLHTLRSDTAIAAERIVAQHQAHENPDASASLDLFARLLGDLARELALQYMPLDGIYLAGSVARGVMLAGGQSAMRDSFQEHARFAEQLSPIPLHLITDDAAALTGCAVLAQSMTGSGTGRGHKPPPRND